MLRDKKIEIRLTNEELLYLEDVCNRYSMTKSEYIRKAIYGSNNNIKDIAQHIFVMQQVIDKIVIDKATEEDLDVLINEVGQLWLCLN